jgi:hypothetical protein
VMVRPRTLRNRVSNKMPFKVNVEKLRAAFLWLKAHNPFYVNIRKCCHTITNIGLHNSSFKIYVLLSC